MNPETPSSCPPTSSPGRGYRATPAAMAVVMGLVALSAAASESELVLDIQRYCAACWRNAHLDPNLWDDCTQEVCCRLLTKARAGELDLPRVMAEDSPERRELVRAIDMVRKRVQRARRSQSIEAHPIPSPDHDGRQRERLELGEILEAARRAVLTPRQDRIVDLWSHGWSVPDIAAELGLPVARVSDEKYKSLRKLQRHLEGRSDQLDLDAFPRDELPVRRVG